MIAIILAFGAHALKKILPTEQLVTLKPECAIKQPCVVLIY
jgi:hypothetical protein